MPSPGFRRLRIVGLPVLAAFVAAAALIPGIALRRSATEHDDLAAASQIKVDDVRIVESSKRLIRIVYGELVARVHADLDPGSQDAVDRREQARIEEGATLIALLTAAADDDTLRAGDARRSLEEIEFSVLLESDAPLDGVSSLHGFLFGIADTAESDVRSGRYVSELSDLTALPALIADESLIAHVARTRPAVSPDVAEYVEQSWEFVEDTAGWLGPDGEMTGAFAFFDAPVALGRSPAILERMDATLSASGLIPVDAWLQGLDEEAGPSPASPGETVAMAELTEGRLVELADAAISEEIGRLARDATVTADEAERRARSSTILLSVAAVAAAIAAILTARAFGHSFRRARLASVDQLTGIGNRHVLDDATAVLLADKRLTEHAVAVVDCDRFKMFNDLYGHDAGDRILVEIANRLESAAAFLRRRHAARTTLVRLGGDEFLLSVHARDRITSDDVREVLDAERRRQFSLADGTPIDIEFSVGVVAASSPASLQDLMQQADLAVYEDKAERREQLQDLPAPSERTDSAN
ncbi:MAG: diguanylate cyclase [Ilumatobacter sp.]